jgi:hypothetical protein
MGQPITEQELRRRAIAGVRDEVEAFGSAADNSLLIRREGLLASVVPASPQRSLFNSVHYDEPAALAREIDSLGTVYDEHDVRAWTVWVPDEDRETARMLAGRGHSLDAAPRAMAMRLAELGAEPGSSRGRATRRSPPSSTIAPTAMARTASAPASPVRPRSAGMPHTPTRSRSAVSVRSRSAGTAASPGSRRRLSTVAAGLRAGCCSAP